MNNTSETAVENAINECRIHLLEREYDEVMGLNGYHREWGLALETLCDILIERNISLSGNQIKVIEVAFAAMGLDPGGRILDLDRGFSASGDG